MPTYGYQCTRCNEQFEVTQRITEDPLTEHDGCGGELRKLVYPVGIMFKGPGFHVNDYGRNGKAASPSATNGSSEPAAGSQTPATPAASTPASEPAKSGKPAKPETAAKPATAAAAK